MTKRTHVPGLSWRGGVAYWQRQHKRMGRVYKSLGTRIESRAAARASALNMLMERGDWDTIALWVADVVAIEDIAAAARRGDWHKLTAATTPTLAEMVESYLARDIEPGTAAGYRTKTNRLLAAFSTVEELDTATAQSWLHSTGWARSTQGKARTLFSSIWTHAGQADIWQGVQLGTIPQPKPKALRVEDWQGVVEHSTTPRERQVLALGALAGLRQAEMRFLRPRDVNLFARVVEIRARSTPHSWKPKYGKERDVPMGDELVLMLRAYTPGEVYWFEERAGQPVSSTTLEGWVREMFERVGLRYGQEEGFTAHSLRHSFGTWLAASGAGLNTIAAMMGITVKTAATYYIHAMPGEAERASEALSARVTTLAHHRSAKFKNSSA